ncbi:heat-inducible transcriptional repressor HrcA [Tissierella praeacuta]|uniref:Heat-inducible transcription repressor HrcA n=1 Tax=Tissierella praeacuta DSM 18095 TaxID=1123404 RepID=A0A1M4S8C8_9FIRM|nr:heat-inducible transcriptional repressor HrcA [Tissierella praeacuta]MBU5256799.1 heat-inducible transcriptional repressor HrcA [Tissierella praeacuta]TCU71710.1 heat-inducible transcription repressor HrcA [Tissierella praeacuta]SHE28418.1 heat-inducible transcription repressor HrcA [Tissierella praeacuta DSM 18095]SUP01097.1 Heat-inducible transcription repressor HrcA [Tissierella praeacuta]
MLDDRKLKVLYAIINSYVSSAEPIGSRTITKQYDLGVSSATIRNEMSDLEELGYLNKPHSSSGRVPSDKAYRLYVDEILKKKKPKIDLIKKDEIKRILARESREIEQLIQNSAKVLSSITSYTALAISPQLKGSRIKHIQLIPIDNLQILMVLVTNTGVVKNSIFKLNKEIPEEQTVIISNFLNDKLKGLSIDEIGDEISDGIIKEIYDYKTIIDGIIPIISQSMDDVDNVDLYADGITRILDFPEYRDLEKAKSFISFIEDKDLVVDLLLNNSLSQDIEITIGNENIYDAIKDCSLITTTYKLGDKTIGKIGIIGPTRMDYLALMNIMHLFSVNITEIINMLMSKHISK